MTRQEQLLWLLLIVSGFFSGGVMYSRILPKLFLKKDICSNSPDKNPGASNVFVSCGVTLGMLCLLMDMLKGFVPVYFAGPAESLLCRGSVRPGAGARGRAL